MATQLATINSFNSGEMSPTMIGRSDWAGYTSALLEASNFILTAQGPALRRSGTAFVSHSANKDEASVLLPFILNDDTSYCVEISASKIRFFTPNGAIFAGPPGSTQIELHGMVYNSGYLTFTVAANVSWDANEIKGSNDSGVTAKDVTAVMLCGFTGKVDGLTGRVCACYATSAGTLKVAITGTSFVDGQAWTWPAGSRPYILAEASLPSPYDSDELPLLNHLQYTNSLMIFSPKRKPKSLVLSKSGESVVWSLSDYALEGPYIVPGDSAGAVDAEVTAITNRSEGGPVPVNIATEGLSLVADEANTAVNAAHGPLKAIDGNTATYWLTREPPRARSNNCYYLHIRKKTGAVEIRKIKFVAIDNPLRGWTLYGRSAASNWVRLALGIYGRDGALVKEHNINNLVSCSEWKFVPEVKTSGQPLKIQSLELFANLTLTSGDQTVTIEYNRAPLLGNDIGFLGTKHIGMALNIKGKDGNVYPFGVSAVTDNRRVVITPKNSLDTQKFAGAFSVSSTLRYATWVDAWISSESNPVDGLFFNDRLILLGGGSTAGWVFGSAVSDYSNFMALTADGEQAPDLGWGIMLHSRMLSRNRWIDSQPKSLFVGTDTGVWEITAVNKSKVMSAGNIQAEQISTRGVAPAPPVRRGRSVMYIPKSRAGFRELRYSYEVDGTIDLSLTKFADHLTKDGIMFASYMDDPEDIIWIITGGGELVGMTYDDVENVMAWHKHALGGANSVAAVTVLSMCVTPSKQGGAEDLWLLVKRPGAGGPVHSIERLMPAWGYSHSIQGTRAADKKRLLNYPHFLDMGVLVEKDRPSGYIPGYPLLGELRILAGEAGVEIDGLWWLSGTSIKIVLDNGSVLSKPVANGKAEITNEDLTGDPAGARPLPEITKALVGYNYTSKLTTSPLASAIGQPGSYMYRPARIDVAIPLFWKSKGGSMGSWNGTHNRFVYNDLNWSHAQYNQVFDSVTADGLTLTSAALRSQIADPDYNHLAVLSFMQNDPYPFNLVSYLALMSV